MYIEYDIFRDFYRFENLPEGESFCMPIGNSKVCGIKISPVKDYDSANERDAYNAILFFNDNMPYIKMVWIDLDFSVEKIPMSIYFGED